MQTEPMSDVEPQKELPDYLRERMRKFTPATNQLISEMGENFRGLKVGQDIRCACAMVHALGQTISLIKSTQLEITAVLREEIRILGKWVDWEIAYARNVHRQALKERKSGRELRNLLINARHSPANKVSGGLVAQYMWHF